MSKLSFRARALDATRAMPIFRKDEVADLPDYSVLHRAVPQMPTGMDKEEESEHHLQRAISAQQVYGDKKVMVIPVPEAELGVEYYNSVYKKQFHTPKQYIHNQAQALNSIMDQEKPDYDMDSDDEQWMRDTKRSGLEITEIQFEEMIDRLEKSCGNQVVSLQEAKLLLKEDDDVIRAVYDYWLRKRAGAGTGLLMLQVRQERRDGSSNTDSYVAFRRRTEKMQTRKNRKNDEASYEKMLKLRRELTRAVTIVEMVKRREKCKWELLHLMMEIVEKRYEMEDWDGKAMKMAKRGLAIGQGNLKAITGRRIKSLSGVKAASGANAATVAKQRIKAELEREKRRKSKKIKDKIRLSSTTPSISTTATSICALPGSSAAVVHHSPHKHVPVVGTAAKSPSYSSNLTYEQAVDTMRQYEFHSSDEEILRPKSPVSGSVAPADERKKNPDGAYAFKRKPGCRYETPWDDLCGDHWPWMSDDRHSYSLATLTVPEKCMGFCRRRVGRGGRTLVDRAYCSRSRQLSEIDLHPETNHLPHDRRLQQLFEEIKHSRWRRYRPYKQPSCEGVSSTRNDDQPTPVELTLKPFGHSPLTGKHSVEAKGLLPKQLFQKSPGPKSTQKNRITNQKRMSAHSSQKAKAKTENSQQLKPNVISGSPASDPVSNSALNHPTTIGMALIGTVPGASPGKYNVSNLLTSQRSGKLLSASKGKRQTVSRFTLDQAKFYGVKGQEKVHATLVPVSGLQSRSFNGPSVKLTVTGSSPKVSLTAAATLATVTTSASSRSHLMTTLSAANSRNTICSAVAEATNTSGTVYITPTARVPQPTKTSVGKLQLPRSVPVPLAAANAANLVQQHFKHSQQGVVLGSQSLSLALTPTTPQKQAAMPQLSIPNSGGHASAILIATPASGTLASSLPPRGNLTVDGSNPGSASFSTHQAKTVSINVARVQASPSGVGQIFTLQQHPDGTLTVPGSQVQGTQHSGSSWVASGANILKLGPAGLPAGVQVHPVTAAAFKMATANKSLTVISKPPGLNPPRTINIANARQVATNNSKLTAGPSQITLVPDNRNNLSVKPLISIKHSRKTTRQ